MQTAKRESKIYNTYGKSNNPRKATAPKAYRGYFLVFTVKVKNIILYCYSGQVILAQNFRADHIFAGACRQCIFSVRDGIYFGGKRFAHCCGQPHRRRPPIVGKKMPSSYFSGGGISAPCSFSCHNLLAVFSHLFETFMHLSVKSSTDSWSSS